MANAIFTGASFGLWSVPSNWSGGTLPQVGDDVYSNTKINILIDVSINVNSLNNSAAAPAVAGGNFAVDFRSGNINISARTITSTLTINVLALYLESGQTVTISGNTTGGSTGIGLYVPTSGTLNVYGNITGGTGAGGYGLLGRGNSVINIYGDLYKRLNGAESVFNENMSTINITGNTYRLNNALGTIISNGSTSTGIISYSGQTLSTSAVGNDYTITNNNGTIILKNPNIGQINLGSFLFNNGGTLIVNGDFNLGSGTTAGPIIDTRAYSNVKIYGNIINTARTVTSIVAPIAIQTTPAIINVYGNVMGGNILNSMVISNNIDNGIINIYGNISGGTFTGNAPAIYSTNISNIYVSGNCVAGSYPALVSTNILTTNVVGGLVFNTASTPYYAYRLNVTPTPSTITSTNVTGGTKIFTTSGYTYGIPLSGNVRSGISYGYMNEYRGSMNIPSKHSVKIGTPFDSGNTYGEAIITTNDLNAIFKSFSFTGL